MKKAITIFREIGYAHNLSMCLADLAFTESDYGNAERAVALGQESLAIGRKLGNNDRITYACCVLGLAACTTGDYETSRVNLTKALENAWKNKKADFIPVCIYFFAILLVEEAAHTEAAKCETLTLLTLVSNQPATWQPIKDHAARFQARLVKGLSPDLVDSAMEEGKAMSVEEAVALLLPELIGNSPEPCCPMSNK